MLISYDSNHTLLFSTIQKTREVVKAVKNVLRHGEHVPRLHNPDAGGEFTLTEIRDELGAVSFLLGVFVSLYA